MDLQANLEQAQQREEAGEVQRGGPGLHLVDVAAVDAQFLGDVLLRQAGLLTQGPKERSKIGCARRATDYRSAAPSCAWVQAQARSTAISSLALAANRPRPLAFR